jgi:oligopeptide/dipeptide ABC transporter ATP-binding protein
MNASPPVLEVRDLVKHYSLRQSFLAPRRGSVRAVDGVSFAVAAGTTLAIVGESGCGKSTTARLILQLEPPDSGEILIEGRLVTGPSMALRQAVQMVFQDPYASLTPHFTVRATLREPLVLHRICSRREADCRIAAILEAVGLHPDIMRRYPHELSGGQRQRVAIARALAVEPRLIVCDEPVSALDVSIRSQIINLLLLLQRDRGLTYLFISHDLDLVEHISDTVAVMYLGRLVELAPAEQLFAGPLHPYTRALLASSPVPDPHRRLKAAPLRGEVASVTDVPSGCPFRSRCPLAIDRCAEVAPRLREIRTGHRSACHRGEELADGHRTAEIMRFA